VINDLAKSFLALSPHAQDLVVKFGLIAIALGPLTSLIGGVTKGIGLLMTAVRALMAADGLAGVAALLAPGGELIVGLGLLAAVFAAFSVGSSAADTAIDSFKNSLAGLTQQQLVDKMGALTKSLAAQRKAVSELSAVPVAGRGSSNTDRLSAANAQVKLLEKELVTTATLYEQNAARARAFAAANAALGTGGATGTDKPGQAFKDLIAGAETHLTQLAQIGERYDDQTRNLTTAADLLTNLNDRLHDQRPVLATLTTDMETINKAIRSGTLDVDERAKALKTVLDITKAIGAASDPSKALQGIAGFASSKLGSTAQLADTGPFAAALDDARLVLNVFKTNLDAHVLPATAENMAAFVALSASLTRASEEYDKLTANVRVPDRLTPEGRRDAVTMTARQNFEAPIDAARNAVPAARARLTETFGNQGMAFQAMLDRATAGLLNFVTDLAPASVATRALGAAASFARGIISAVGDAINPVAQIITAIGTATKPLMPVFARLAAIVANTLGPIFQAFAPVLEALLPLIDAVLRVLSPILQALAPLFKAFIPILVALFPIFKDVAIAATYVAQVFEIVAAAVTRAVGNIIIGFGTIVKAIAQAIDALPFVSAKHAIQAAQGIIDFGDSLLQSADDFTDAANAMAKARGEIEGISVSDTQTAIDSLGAAANLAAGALNNVPEGYKVALARFNATAPVMPKSPSAPTPPLLPVTPPGLSFPSPTPPPPESGGGSSGGSTPPTDQPAEGGNEITATGDVRPVVAVTFGAGSVVIQGANKSAGDLFDDMLAEGQRRARAQLGDSTKWAEVQT
jgi:hypothetical protein